MKLVKQNKFFYLETTLYILFLYGTSVCVFLNGDDFMYGSFAKNNILQSVASYYITGNGRFWINILDSLLLSFDRYLFIAITPLIIMLFIVLLAKNIQWISETKPDHQKEQKYIRYGMVLFACLDVLCLRETVFWITGMMNYLFPAVVFLFAFFLFQHIRSNPNVSIVKKTLYCVICLFAGSSVEQYALMFVGMMTLLLGADLLCKRKVPKVLLTGYLCSLIGLCILFLAPGNFVRVDTQSELMPSFIENLWTLVYQNTLSPVAFPYLLMLSLIGNVYICKIHQSKLIRTGSMFVPISMIAIRCLPIMEQSFLIAGVLILFIIQMIYMFIKQNHSEKQTIYSLIFVGLGSQVMLLISAIWGFRCMFSMYIVYMLLILFYLTKLDANKRAFILCSGIVGSLSPSVLVGLWCVLFFIKKKENLQLTIMNILTRTSVVVAMAILLLGYASNVNAHIANIEQTKLTSDYGELSLQELPNDTYSWHFLPMGEFHENYYRVYHCISDSVVINYKTNKEVQ